jgi:hypothetical protein
VQNQVTLNYRMLIQNKVASFIITGGDVKRLRELEAELHIKFKEVR